MNNPNNLRPGGPGRPRGSKNKMTKERHLLLQAEEHFNSRDYWEHSAWPRIARGKAPHLESYFLQRIYGRPVESVALTGEARKPVRVTIQVVREEPLLAAGAPAKPLSPGQLAGPPPRGSDWGGDGHTGFDLHANKERRRPR